jgi:hypothetical protein
LVAANKGKNGEQADYSEYSVSFHGSFPF